MLEGGGGGDEAIAFADCEETRIDALNDLRGVSLWQRLCAGAGDGFGGRGGGCQESGRIGYGFAGYRSVLFSCASCGCARPAVGWPA
jgi:hypothetical protein